MDYLIKINKNHLKTASIALDGFEVYIANAKHIWIENERCTALVIGDCVDIDNLKKDVEIGVILQTSMSWYNGNFHTFCFDKERSTLTVFNSLWGIISLYYAIIDDFFYFSSSLSSISNKLNVKNLNNKYFLQTILFNYSLGNDTYWEGINIIPVNSYLEINSDSKIYLKKYFETESLFHQNLKGGNKVLSDLADFFINDTFKWFPDEKFAISFTGGFDGRTIVSIANNFHLDFFTYAFGNEQSTDLILPKHQAKILGLRFKELKLDDKYIKEYYPYHYADIIYNSNGQAGMNRAHYNFAAKELGKDVKYILTGNYGSEIFRTMNVTGAMFSVAMYKLMKYRNIRDWRLHIKTDDTYLLLKGNLNNTAFEETIHDLEEILKRNKSLPRNLLIYKILLEEVFRKYFGPEIVMQGKYLTNRTPFLNIRFLKELNKTIFSGAYGPFFTNNPFLRYHGQMVYSKIIQKTSDILYRAPTNKGYTPKDLNTLNGKLKLILNYIKKRQGNFIQEDDPFSVRLAYMHNSKKILDQIKGIDKIDSIFLQNLLTDGNPNRFRAGLRVLSVLYFINSENHER